MRNCCNCNVKLDLGINWSLSGPKHGVYKCKTCIKNRVKKHKLDNPNRYSKYHSQHYKDNREQRIENEKKHKDGLYYVYLRKDNYAGATDNPYKRAIKHKQFLCILHSTPSVEDASELEELLHDMGYKGRGKKTYAQQLAL